MKKYFLCFLFVLSLCSFSIADQPVMNEAPRWAGGWGFQVRHLHRDSDDLISGDDEIVNPLGLSRRVNTTLLEGVYTFDRSKRITVKIPWVEQTRVTNISGTAVKQKSEGLGDVIVGVPLRKYINYRDWTSNFSLTPSIRFSTGQTEDDYPISDGSTDAGLSLSYSAESPEWFGSADLFHWFNHKGERGQHEGDETGLDITLGKIIYHNGKKSAGAQIQLDMGARYKAEGLTLSGNNPGTRVFAGPAFTYFQGPTYFRVVYNIPIYEDAKETTVSYGDQLDIGMGWVF